MNIQSDFINLNDLNVLELPGVAGSGKPISVPLKTLPVKRKNVFNFRKYNFTEEEYQIPEYNLYEISTAEDADGIIRQAIKKKRALSVKQGWELIGKNNATVAYVSQRLKQIEIAQNYPFRLLVKDTLGDLVRYHNAFWIKLRDKKNSGGKTRRVRTYNGEKDLQPVCAYFRVAPETMLVKTDKYGNPTWYMQEMPDGRSKEYVADDVVHFVFNKRAGFIFAAPGLQPAIDDIRALRRIEENVELLIEQYLFPLFILTIGTDDFPTEIYQDNTNEVDLWTSKINEMPVSGGIVVSHRLKFDTLGFDKILPVEKYLDHFKRRAYTSAGVSSLDMGEGDGMNRSTADNASRILIDDVKDYQQEFEYQFNFEILNELLLERYNITCLDDQNIVMIDFNEIDLESMMKTENHNALMYSMNSLTEDEMRHRNRQPVIDDDEEREKLYLHKYEKEKIRFETESAKEINASKPKTTSSTSSSSSKAKNIAKNRQQPTNQHGKSLGPTKRKSSISSEEGTLRLFLDNLTIYDIDSTKIRLINHIFSLDLANLSPDNCYRIILHIDDYVNDAYTRINKGIISPESATDLLVKKTIALLESLD